MKRHFNRSWRPLSFEAHRQIPIECWYSTKLMLAGCLNMCWRPVRPVCVCVRNTVVYGSLYVWFISSYALILHMKSIVTAHETNRMYCLSIPSAEACCCHYNNMPPHKNDMCASQDIVSKKHIVSKESEDTCDTLAFVQKAIEFNEKTHGVLAKSLLLMQLTAVCPNLRHCKTRWLLGKRIAKHMSWAFSLWLPLLPLCANWVLSAVLNIASGNHCLYTPFPVPLEDTATSEIRIAWFIS